MIIFDTLSELESYVPALKDLVHVITLLDRSIPYRDKPGTYSCPEKNSVTYVVDSFMTGQKGHEFSVEKGKVAVLVTLEGEQIVSLDDGGKVFIMAEGRFIALSEGTYRKGISTSLPSAVKDVVFTL